MAASSPGTPLRILVVGGAGAFGSRLVRGLLAGTAFDIVVGGRRSGPVAAFAAECNRGTPRPRVSALALDRGSVAAGDLVRTGAFAVVDAAGPFQGGDYRLARAAIAAGMHYVDLADARDFVAGFSSLDGAAKAAGVVALTGASSTPALSNAALDRLTAGWQGIDAVEVAISPGNRAPRGLSVVRAILSYAGRPVRVFAEGRWTARPGWGITVRRRIPGLGKRWLSLCETPDLDILPGRFGVTRSAVFRAGLELSALHLGLLAASFAVRAGLLRSLAPHAAGFRSIAQLAVPFGSDRGGMLVEATGIDPDGRPVRATWTLSAEGGDGPFVPVMPALAALRALAEDRLAAPGARACVGLLPLQDIEAEFRALRITTATTLARDGVGSLYRRVLGDAFDRLPAPIRALHEPTPSVLAAGIAQVDGADTLVARVAAWLFRFPAAGSRAAARVTITAAGGHERWVREFGGTRFASRLRAAATPGRLVERFGPFSFELDLPAGPEGILGMPVRRWRLGPLPLPLAFAPLSFASEHVDAEGRFRFDVELRLPLRLGRIVRYRGWLEIASTAPVGPAGP